jgi:hypothetical protein
VCGLCGILLGDAHWTETAVSSPQEGGRTRRHERLHRVALANRVLRTAGLRLSDWQGTAYVLTGPTGGAAVVEDFAALWPLAGRYAKRTLDPLDAALIDALERD